MVAAARFAWPSKKNARTCRNCSSSSTSPPSLSATSTRYILDTMARTRSGPQRLKAGVPSGWQVAHKTGTITAVHHDAGIVYATDVLANDDEVDDRYYENKQINAPLCSQVWSLKEKCGMKCKRLSKEKGSGLGLAIVEKAMQRMGGQFEIDNAPDGGPHAAAGHPAVTGAETGANHVGYSRLLGHILCRCAQGHARALSPPSVARRPHSSRPNPARQTAWYINPSESLLCVATAFTPCPNTIPEKHRGQRPDRTTVEIARQ